MFVILLAVALVVLMIVGIVKDDKYDITYSELNIPTIFKCSVKSINIGKVTQLRSFSQSISG